jgi:hypothetical protein
MLSSPRTIAASVRCAICRQAAALVRLAATARRRFSSPGVPPFLAKQENPRRAILRFAAVLADASPSPWRLSIRIEAAMAWPRRGKEMS